jgi:outer membrane receptor protein involved in Fe transport
VNFECKTSGGTVGGGTFPCAISNYSNIEPSTYTFDLSFGYDSGDIPANDYLKHIGIQVVVQNLLDQPAPFEYRVSSGGGNPAAVDPRGDLVGRTFTLILTKTW